jgi:hypothetical protein
VNRTRPDFGSIEGHVHDAAGNALPDVAVIIKTADQPHPDIAALTNTDGGFRLPDLLPGAYVLEAIGAARRPITVSIRVAAGAPTRIGVVVRQD